MNKSAAAMLRHLEGQHRPVSNFCCQAVLLSVSHVLKALLLIPDMTRMSLCVRNKLQQAAQGVLTLTVQ